MFGSNIIRVGGSTRPWRITMQSEPGKLKRNVGIVGLALAVVALVVASWGVVATMSAQAPKTHHLTILMGEGEIIQVVNGTEELTGEFHRWEPGVLVMKRCDTIVLTVKNPRSNIHSFAIPTLGVDTGPIPGKVAQPPSGGVATVTISTCNAGTYQFICDTPHDHNAGECDVDHARMTGYLVVLE